MKRKWISGFILFIVTLAAACWIIMTGDYSGTNRKDSEVTKNQAAPLPSASPTSSSNNTQLLNCSNADVTVPPEINISVDGLSLNYITQKTRWNGEEQLLSVKEFYNKITETDPFIPTFRLKDMGYEFNPNGGQYGLSNKNNRVTIDFGNSMPDDVKIYDDILNDSGEIRYNRSTTQTEYIMVDSKVKFNLRQHMAYYLSSYSGDYEIGWMRMLRVVCKWGSNEGTYAILLNTDKTEALTEISDHNFMDCVGTYSQPSSNLGIGLTIDSTNLPEQYIVEWQVSDGRIIVWNKGMLSSYKPYPAMETHHGYPMTRSVNTDDNVIWRPITYDNNEEVTIKAYIYEKEEDKSPVAFSEIKLENKNGVFQKKQN